MNRPSANNIAIIFIYLTSYPLASVAREPQNFSEAKRAATKIYEANPKTFYCGCTYAKIGKSLTPDLKSCGYSYRKNYSRSLRIEWEHVVPAYFFGKDLNCWKIGGRKNCKKDKRFNQMEADLHNLVPAIGEVNGDRNNYSFAIIKGEIRNYGKCDFEVDFKLKQAEPRPEIRGDIARIYFYMSKKYNLKLSEKEQKLFYAWDKNDPIDAWEKKKIKMIEFISN